MEAVSNQAVKLSELLEHSRAMLERAEAGEWEAVFRDEAVQRELIDAVFASPYNLVDEAGLRKSLEDVLQINQRLEELAAHARDHVNTQRNKISEGRKAVQAYTDHSR